MQRQENTRSRAAHTNYFVINHHHTWTTPPGLRPIMLQIPRKAESFSSLSRMFRNDVHLKVKNLHTQNDQFSLFPDFSRIKFPFSHPFILHCKNDTVYNKIIFCDRDQKHHWVFSFQFCLFFKMPIFLRLNIKVPNFGLILKNFFPLIIS